MMSKASLSSFRPSLHSDLALSGATCNSIVQTMGKVNPKKSEDPEYSQNIYIPNLPTTKIIALSKSHLHSQFSSIRAQKLVGRIPSWWGRSSSFGILLLAFHMQNEVSGHIETLPLSDTAQSTEVIQALQINLTHPWLGPPTNASGTQWRTCACQMWFRSSGHSPKCPNAHHLAMISNERTFAHLALRNVAKTTSKGWLKSS